MTCEVNQSALPWCTAYGQPTETVIHTTDFDAWSAERQRECHHEFLDHRCPWCRGTLVVSELLAISERVRIYPGI